MALTTMVVDIYISTGRYEICKSLETPALTLRNNYKP